MTNAGFIGYAQSKGYRCLGDSAAFGAHRGYPFVAVFKAARQGSITVSMTVEGKVDGKLLKAIRADLPKGCVSQPARSQGTVVFTVQQKDADPTPLFEQVLEAVATHFREAGLTPSDTCPVCHQTGCDGLAFLNGAYVPVHQACVRSEVQAVSLKAQKNQRSGNYIIGALGALLGGLVGTIPNVIAAVWLERIVAILYALIPLGAYYGYKLFKGRMNKSALVFTILSSVFNLFMVEYITQYVWVCLDFEGLFDLGLFTQIFFLVLQEGELTSSLLQGALFLALGLWFSWSQISHTSRQDVQGAATVQATVQPWDGHAIPAEQQPAYTPYGDNSDPF